MITRITTDIPFVIQIPVEILPQTYKQQEDAFTKKSKCLYRIFFDSRAKLLTAIRTIDQDDISIVPNNIAKWAINKVEPGHRHFLPIQEEVMQAIILSIELFSI